MQNATDEPKRLDSHYSFDLSGQALDALRYLAELLPRTSTDPYLWKWALFALFDAFHGFLALALWRAHGAQLLSERHERRTYRRWEQERAEGGPLIAVDDEGKPKKDRVAETAELYNRVQEPVRMTPFCYSQELRPTDEQDSAVRYLIHLRHVLTHYSDVSQVVNIAELPGTVVDVLSVIAWLWRDSGVITLVPEVDDAVGPAIDRVRTEAERLAHHYHQLDAAE